MGNLSAPNLLGIDRYIYEKRVFDYLVSCLGGNAEDCSDMSSAVESKVRIIMDRFPGYYQQDDGNMLTGKILNEVFGGEVDFSSFSADVKRVRKKLSIKQGVVISSQMLRDSSASECQELLGKYGMVFSFLNARNIGRDEALADPYTVEDAGFSERDKKSIDELFNMPKSDIGSLPGALRILLQGKQNSDVFKAIHYVSMMSIEGLSDQRKFFVMMCIYHVHTMQTVGNISSITNIESFLNSFIDLISTNGDGELTPTIFTYHLIFLPVLVNSSGSKAAKYVVDNFGAYNDYIDRGILSSLSLNQGVSLLSAESVISLISKYHPNTIEGGFLLSLNSQKSITGLKLKADNNFSQVGGGYGIDIGSQRIKIRGYTHNRRNALYSRLVELYGNNGADALPFSLRIVEEGGEIMFDLIGPGNIVNFSQLWSENKNIHKVTDRNMGGEIDRNTIQCSHVNPHAGSRQFDKKIEAAYQRQASTPIFQRFDYRSDPSLNREDLSCVCDFVAGIKANGYTDNTPLPANLTGMGMIYIINEVRKFEESDIGEESIVRYRIALVKRFLTDNIGDESIIKDFLQTVETLKGEVYFLVPFLFGTTPGRKLFLENFRIFSESLNLPRLSLILQNFYMVNANSISREHTEEIFADFLEYRDDRESMKFFQSMGILIPFGTRTVLDREFATVRVNKNSKTLWLVQQLGMHNFRGCYYTLSPESGDDFSLDIISPNRRINISRYLGEASKSGLKSFRKTWGNETLISIKNVFHGDYTVNEFKTGLTSEVSAQYAQESIESLLHNKVLLNPVLPIGYHNDAGMFESMEQLLAAMLPSERPVDTREYVYGKPDVSLPWFQFLREKRVELQKSKGRDIQRVISEISEYVDALTTSVSANTEKAIRRILHLAGYAENSMEELEQNSRAKLPLLEILKRRWGVRSRGYTGNIIHRTGVTQGLSPVPGTIRDPKGSPGQLDEKTGYVYYDKLSRLFDLFVDWFPSDSGLNGIIHEVKVIEGDGKKRITDHAVIYVNTGYFDRQDPGYTIVISNHYSYATYVFRGDVRKYILEGAQADSGIRIKDIIERKAALTLDDGTTHRKVVFEGVEPEQLQTWDNNMALALNIKPSVEEITTQLYEADILSISALRWGYGHEVMVGDRRPSKMKLGGSIEYFFEQWDTCVDAYVRNPENTDFPDKWKNFLASVTRPQDYKIDFRSVAGVISDIGGESVFKHMNPSPEQTIEYIFQLLQFNSMNHDSVGVESEGSTLADSVTSLYEEYVVEKRHEKFYRHLPAIMKEVLHDKETFLSAFGAGKKIADAARVITSRLNVHFYGHEVPSCKKLMDDMGGNSECFTHLPFPGDDSFIPRMTGLEDIPDDYKGLDRQEQARKWRVEKRYYYVLYLYNKITEVGPEGDRHFNEFFTGRLIGE